MILTSTIKVKGKAYELSLDTLKADRNYEDENFAEWFIHPKNGCIIEVTVWKDNESRFTNDGTVEVYKNQGDF